MRTLRGFLIGGAVAASIVMTAFIYLVISQAYVGFVRRDAEQRASSFAEAMGQAGPHYRRTGGAARGSLLSAYSQPEDRRS